ncbi:MAG: hypothetical protein ACRD6B_13720, partial [Bryobacteraceae bacterium]
MKAIRVLFLNLAAAGFLCLPVVSAYGAAPQDQHDQNSNANHEHGKEHGKTNHEHEKKAQEHHSTQTQHNSNRAHAEHAQQERGNRNHTQTARERGHQRMPSYNFRAQDQQRLRQDYNRSNYRHEVNTRRRARLSRGGYLPNGWRGHMHRLPPQY